MTENIVDIVVGAVAASIFSHIEGGNSARILIALSGGPDSTALLLAVHRLAQVSGLGLAAAHVNHHLRGTESDDEEEFCRQLCTRLNIPLDIFQDISSVPSDSEESLRKRRYDFLIKVASDGNFNAVMTAHTVNDQAETVLFRLIRGTSLKGLGGIKTSREIGDRLFLLRPLLSISREEVLTFLDAMNVTACDDSSNAKTKYSRNYIRQAVLKPIEERFVGASERIADFAAKASMDNDFIEQQTQRIFAQFDLAKDFWKLDDVKNLHPSVLTRIIASALRQREIEVDGARIQALLAMLLSDAQDRFSLNGKWEAVVDGSRLKWHQASVDSTEGCPTEFEKIVDIPGTTQIAGTEKFLLVEVFEGEEKIADAAYCGANSLEAFVDLSAFKEASGARLVLRRRCAGDFIQPLGMTQNVRLKKYLHTKKANSHVPFLENHLEAGYLVSHCIVLACGREILWVPGIGLSDRVKVQANGKPTHKFSIVNVTT